MKKTKFSPFRTVVSDNDPINRLSVVMSQQSSSRLVQRLQGLSCGYHSRLRPPRRECESSTA